jgi:hypothetical protein
MKHQTTILTLFTSKILCLITITFSALSAGNLTYAQEHTALGTSKIWATLDGIAIEGVVQGPGSQLSELQVACVFEYVEGDIFNSPPALPAALNGMVHLDQDLKGRITEIRKSGKFAGHAFETLLLSPPKGMIGGKQLLLIGLGDRNQFRPELMTSVGSVAMREAMKLGVTNFSFASDLKDAGIDSPTALVATNVVKGIFQSYRTQVWLQELKLVKIKPLNKVILLAGPSFFTTAGQGIQEAVASLKR